MSEIGAERVPGVERKRSHGAKKDEIQGTGEGINSSKEKG